MTELLNVFLLRRLVLLKWWFWGSVPSYLLCGGDSTFLRNVVTPRDTV